jgi:glycosyltransferase involved in cell wall biosynthesis
MKFLHIIPSINPLNGGTVAGLLQMSMALLKLKHKVDVLCFDTYSECIYNDFEHIDGVKVHYLGPGFFNYKFSFRIMNWLRSNHMKYDAVIVEGVWQFHSIATYLTLRFTNTSYFVFTHGMLSPWFKKRYPLKHIKKLIYWYLIESRVLKGAAKVFFTAEDEKVLALSTFKSKPHYISCVVGYGIIQPERNLRDHSKEIFLLKFPHLREKKIILFLGRIHEVKGCDILIEAFAKIVKIDKLFHLVMAGPDNNHLSTILKERIINLGLKNRITWTGMLEKQAKWGAYFSSDVFVLPSHQENFGVVVAEALACNLPVLITNKVNIYADVLKSNAGLVSDDSFDGIYYMLMHWFKLDESSKDQMRQNAFHCFNNYFNIDKAAINLTNEVEISITK